MSLPAFTFDDHVLRHANLATIWYVHQDMNEGDVGVLAGFDQWSTNRMTWGEGERTSRLLSQHAHCFSTTSSRGKDFPAASKLLDEH